MKLLNYCRKVEKSRKVSFLLISCRASSPIVRKMLKTVGRRLAQRPRPAATVPFSSAPPRRPEAFDYNQEVTKYKEELSLRRKAYAAEVAVRVAEEAKRAKDERTTIAAAKLERLQVKLERSRIRAQSVAIERVLDAMYTSQG